MLNPATFPCQAWYVTDFGLRETTLTGWYGTQAYHTLRCENKTKRKLVSAHDVFDTPGHAISGALAQLNLEKIRLEKLLTKCQQRIVAVEALKVPA